jgi:hypothetical protein
MPLVMGILTGIENTKGKHSMAKVITLSRYFPSYHPKAGQPTYFVEKVWNGFHEDALGERFYMPFEEDIYDLNSNRNISISTLMEFKDSLVKGRTNKFEPKYHTVRSGKRWKAGDKASLRVWSGVPYDSKQIILAPDIVIPKVLDVEMYYSTDGKLPMGLTIEIDGAQYPYGCNEWIPLSQNDGLELLDMKHWFELSPDFKKEKHFSGQMIFVTDVKTPY